MGYILSELEKESLWKGEDWKNLAKEVVSYIEKTNDANFIELKNLKKILKEKNKSNEEINWFEGEYAKRELNKIENWIIYKNAREKRLSKDEAFSMFSQTLKKIQENNGVLDENFKITNLYAFGSFVRPFNKEKPYGDIDLFAEFEWTGKKSASFSEKELLLKQLMDEKPFGDFVEIGVAGYSISGMAMSINEPAEEKKWQAVQVWQTKDIIERTPHSDLPSYHPERLFKPLTKEEFFKIKEQEKNAFSLNNDEEWKSLVKSFLPNQDIKSIFSERRKMINSYDENRLKNEIKVKFS